MAALLDAAPQFLYALVFLIALAEATPVVGLVVPGQTSVVAAGFLAGRGDLSVVTLVGLVAAGAFIGDVIGYSMGRRYGDRFMAKWPRWFRMTPRRRAQLKRLYADHGLKAVVLGRFQPISRTVGPYLAGSSKMRLPWFLLANALGSVLAATALVGGGYLAGLGFTRLGRAAGWAGATVGLLLLLVIGYLVYRYWLNADRDEPAARATEKDDAKR